MDVSCTKCGKELPVDHGQADDAGLLHLQCSHCGKKLIVKLNRPNLKLSADIPNTFPGLSLTDLAQKAESNKKDASEGVPVFWAARVSAFPSESVGALRAVLTQIPRYSRNPNKIFDLMGALPYLFSGLSFQEVCRIEACLNDCGATFTSGPERDILGSLTEPSVPEEEAPAPAPAREQATEDIVPLEDLDASSEGDEGAKPRLEEASEAIPDGGEEERPDAQHSEADESTDAPDANEEVLMLAVHSNSPGAEWLTILCERLVLDTPPGERPSIQELKDATTKVQAMISAAARDCGAELVLGLSTSIFTLADGSTCLQVEGQAARRVTPTEGT
jgi:DNA-directed RNA polymerase subunit RPC12/RpoP